VVGLHGKLIKQWSLARKLWLSKLIGQIQHLMVYTMWAHLGQCHSLSIPLRKQLIMHNQALHLTAIPLCSIAAGELSRYVVTIA